MSLQCIDTIKTGRKCNQEKKDVINLVVDRSGSMYNIMDSTIKGINKFIEDQKTLDAECILSLFIFDTVIENPISKANLKTFPGITKEMIQPRHATALYDAIKVSIEDMNNYNYNGDKTIVIMTDGYENSSKLIDRIGLNKLIQESKSNGIKFIYLGANQNAIQVANTIGIYEDSALTYTAEPEYVEQAFRCASLSAKRQRSGVEANFTPLERQSSMNPDEQLKLTSLVSSEYDDDINDLNGLNSLDGFKGFDGLNSLDGLTSLNEFNGFGNGLNSFDGLNSLDSFKGFGDGLNSFEDIGENSNNFKNLFSKQSMNNHISNNPSFDHIYR